MQINAITMDNNNSKLHIEKYIIDQANIEIEHVRSWPTKVMAFYTAINFGIIGAVIALQKTDPPVQLSYCIKTAITSMILFLTYRTLRIDNESNSVK